MVCASGCLPQQHLWSQPHLASLSGALRPAPGQERDSSELSKALHFPSNVLFPGEGRELSEDMQQAEQGIGSCFSQLTCRGTCPAQRPQHLAAPRGAVLTGYQARQRACPTAGFFNNVISSLLKISSVLSEEYLTQLYREETFPFRKL